VVIQYVQHLAHPPVELERWPDDNRNSRIVFITGAIDTGKTDTGAIDSGARDTTADAVDSAKPDTTPDAVEDVSNEAGHPATEKAQDSGCGCRVVSASDRNEGALVVSVLALGVVVGAPIIAILTARLRAAAAGRPGQLRVLTGGGR